MVENAFWRSQGGMAYPSSSEPSSRGNEQETVQIYVFHHDRALLQRALKDRTPESFGPQFTFVDLNELSLPSEAAIADVEPELNRAMLSEYLGILSVVPPKTATIVGTFTYSIPLKFSLAWARETGNEKLFLPEVDFTAIEALLPRLKAEYLYGVEFKHPLADDQGPVRRLAELKGGVDHQALGPYKGSLICSRERFLSLQSYLRQALQIILAFDERQLEGVRNPFSHGAVAARTPDRAEVDRRRSTYGNALERAMALFFSGEQERRLQVRLGELVRALQVNGCQMLREVHRAAVAGTVVLTFCNETYLPVLRSWLEQARQANIHGLLVVSFDAATIQFCREQEIATTLAEIPFPSNLSELWHYRLDITRRILQTGLSVLLSDIDAYWLADPMPRLRAADAHIVASQGTYYPRDVYEHTGIVLCCGFIYYRYAAPTLACLDALCKAVTSDGDDQRVLNRWLLQQGIQWQIPQQVKRTTLQVPASELAFTTYDRDLTGETRCGLKLRLLAHREFQRVLDTSTRPIVSHLYVPKDSEAKLNAYALLKTYPGAQPGDQATTQAHAGQGGPDACPSTLVWLASYPRSGNTMLRTWLKKCFNLESCSVYNDTNDIGEDPAMRALTGHQEREWFYGAPGNFMRLEPLDYAGFSKDREQVSGISLIKTHGLWHRGYQGDQAIYIFRDGRSAIASHAYYQLAFSKDSSKLTNRDASCQQYLKTELESLIVCGRPQCGYWSDNVESWLSNDRSKEFLTFRFEEAIADSPKHLKMIGAYLKRPVIDPEVPTFLEAQKSNKSFFRRGEIAAPEFMDSYLQSLFFAFQWRGMLQAGYIQNYDWFIADQHGNLGLAESQIPSAHNASIIEYVRASISEYGQAVHAINHQSFQSKVFDIATRVIARLPGYISRGLATSRDMEEWHRIRETITSR